MAYNSKAKPIYLGSYLHRGVTLNSKIINCLTLDSTLDKSLSTVIYETCFVNQPYTINIETNLDLSLATIRQIKWKDPLSNSFIETALYSGSILYKYFSGADLNLEGVWIFQSLLDFPDQESISTFTILLEVKPIL